MTAASTTASPGIRVAELLRRPSRGALILLVLVVWIVLYLIFKGRNTLALAQPDLTSLHTRLNDLNANIGQNRNSNPFFVYFINEIQLGVTHFVTFFQHLLSQPSGSRPAPTVGWLGVVAVATYLAALFGNWRVAVLTAVGFVFLGLQGVWQESMDTLALTIAAVLICLVIGIPLGILAGTSHGFERVVTPVLDVMQTMPTFVYLAPLSLFFLIGPATGVIAMVIYAMPPVIRLTAHGIRNVPGETVEAADSLGAAPRQKLMDVLLPMAKRTVIIGVNQTIMAALAMVTIAALVAAPGLGQTVLQALESLDVGTAFNGGLAIVVLAVVLDRVTTAASQRAEVAGRRPTTVGKRTRGGLAAAGAVAAGIAVYVSHTYQLYAIFPDHLRLGSHRLSLQVGPHIESWTTSATSWIQRTFSVVTSGFKDWVTYHALNPLQSLLDNSPWWLTFAAIAAIAFLIGGIVPALIAAACLGLIVGSGLWQDSMDTLAATLIATVVTMAIGIVVGVWMGRSKRADGVIRPFLDAAQVMPPFVYLVPFLALFGSTRFTGIVAAVVYAAPVAVKIVADGIRGVSPTTIEAATASGSNTWQIITKVQLPMSLRSLALATNQGLIYVLSMVVVAGLVGGGALGFDVVNGFAQLSVFGKGLAAGAAIVCLGIMLDRTTQAAARRAEGRTNRGR
jgi:glycine betaine/proline transport system permease protein